MASDPCQADAPKCTLSPSGLARKALAAWRSSRLGRGPNTRRVTGGRWGLRPGAGGAWALEASRPAGVLGGLPETSRLLGRLNVPEIGRAPSAPNDTIHRASGGYDAPERRSARSPLRAGSERRDGRVERRATRDGHANRCGCAHRVEGGGGMRERWRQLRQSPADQRMPVTRNAAWRRPSPDYSYYA